MTTTFSYFVTHELKMFDFNGKQRNFTPTELEFFKMVELAWKTGLNMKQENTKDGLRWTLTAKDNYNDTDRDTSSNTAR